MTWAMPAGFGVEAVRAALKGMSNGTAGFDELKEAVVNARFAVRPTATSVDVLADNWDYQVMPDTATDTLQVALFQRVLSIEQYRELMDMAQYVAPGDGR